MKVAFYLDNKSHNHIDYSNPEGGNPGIGGSQYMFWIISYYLNKKYPDIELHLFAENIEKMPLEIRCCKVNDIIDVVKVADEKSIDIIVCRGPHLKKDFCKELEKTNIKCIVWSHNFENNENAKLISECGNIKRNVCVGKEQYDRLRDHSIFYKSTYIYNTITFNLYDNVECEKIPNSVCFLGSLHKAKGFRSLAKVWSEIEKKVPEAQLFVIGGGNLYDKGAKMGKYGLAAEEYEKSFIKFLSDSDGKIKDNVHFMGVLGGNEKLELMKRSHVGIVNPTGKGETFCIGAIEFEALNVPVVSIRRYSLVETVYDKITGLLFNSKAEFIANVATLLTNEKKRNEIEKKGNEFVKNKFNLDDIVNQWYNLLLDVSNDVEPEQKLSCKNMWNNGKWLREANRKIKKVLPFMPSVLWYESIPSRVKKQLWKILRSFVSNWENSVSEES